MADLRHAERSARYRKVSDRLAMLSDRRLGELVDSAVPVGAGIGGAGAVLEFGDVVVFVKKIPLTEVERRPENLGATANLFGLPTFYQYGVGSTGFGAWREVAAHAMATNWVLDNKFQGFPLMYHWRMLPGSPPADATFAEFGGLDGAVEYWDGSGAVRDRLQAIRDCAASIVLFLEYLPQTLDAWLIDQDVAVYPRVDQALAAGVTFLRDHGMVHFDAHFGNILTDGRQLYFADFGLALSARFELSPDEASFFARHQNYDQAYTATHLVLRLADRVRGGLDRNQFLRDWAQGSKPDGCSAAVSSLLTRHARTSVVMGEFDRRLRVEGKTSLYPADEIEQCRGDHAKSLFSQSNSMTVER